ncbi:single-stranded DNA-binding protein [Schleiferilactobacillus harbinensis]|uniref:Single-stranded DNA-binding protein n=1 Tax=Schleiferilactobacillus harbinensis TaxID=304207 RepID=A0ABU7SZG9_9LACO
MINRVTLVGRLVRDVELKYTLGGTARAWFNLAVTRNFKNANGERDSDFIECTVWGKSAESFVNFTCKGSLVGIEGQIRTRSYEKDGQKVYTSAVSVDSFALLESKAITDARRAGQPVTTAGKDDNVFVAAGNGENIDIADDDLPF